MSIAAKAREILQNTGRSQTWVANEMNRIKPALRMNVKKLSATLQGHRSMSGEEFLAFCMATQTNPADFLANVAS